jgi:tRNA(adenine34) deaminase
MLWESLTPPWRACVAEAWTAYCAGSLPIGAAITDASGHVLSHGRNRIFERAADGDHLHGHRLAHAEMNALLALDHGHTDPRACIVYTTTEPCPLCIGAMRIMRVREIRYASRDPASGSIDLLQATPYMRRGQMRAVGPHSPDLEAVLVAMHVDFVLHADERPDWVIDVWATAVPAGVRLGQKLHRSGRLRDLWMIGASVHMVVDELARSPDVAG